MLKRSSYWQILLPKRTLKCEVECLAIRNRLKIEPKCYCHVFSAIDQFVFWISYIFSFAIFILLFDFIFFNTKNSCIKVAFESIGNISVKFQFWINWSKDEIENTQRRQKYIQFFILLPNWCHSDAQMFETRPKFYPFQQITFLIEKLNINLIF